MNQPDLPALYPVRFRLGGETSRIGYWFEEEQDGAYFLVHGGGIPLVPEAASLGFLNGISGARLAPDAPLDVDVRQTVRAILSPEDSNAGAVLTTLDMVEDLYLTAVSVGAQAAAGETRQWQQVVIEARNAFFEELSVGEVAERVSTDKLVGAVFGLWGVALTYCWWP